eukprot:Anaeramoba_flamelloidesa576387_22.p2 GENE.a576387_22~~a576387_22.p2  ORF type:complete len:143 (+),score=11.72 a576387_22:18-446(+)
MAKGKVFLVLPPLYLTLTFIFLYFSFDKILSCYFCNNWIEDMETTPKIFIQCLLNKFTYHSSKFIYKHNMTKKFNIQANSKLSKIIDSLVVLMESAPDMIIMAIVQWKKDTTLQIEGSRTRDPKKPLDKEKEKEKRRGKRRW